MTIRDQFELDSLINYNKLNFLVAGNIKVFSSGKLLLAGKKEKLILYYDPAQFDFQIEEILLDDNRLSNVWGKSIFRLSFTSKVKSLKCEYLMSIRSQKL